MELSPQKNDRRERGIHPNVIQSYQRKQNIGAFSLFQGLYVDSVISLSKPAPRGGGKVISHLRRISTSLLSPPLLSSPARKTKDVRDERERDGERRRGGGAASTINIAFSAAASTSPLILERKHFFFVFLQEVGAAGGEE